MSDDDFNRSIAVILPCHNEEGAIGNVVADMRRHLPAAVIYVYDNNSTDATREEAAAAGAIVRSEPIQGKGAVVRRMFADIDADIYVMADGDMTYDPESAPKLIRHLIDNQLDMVVGARQPVDAAKTYRRGHVFGNWLLSSTVRFIFGDGFKDMLSGYRILSHRFVKTFPTMSTGFEIETELAVHALSLRIPCAEVATPYFERGEGTQSKLRTYKDGSRIFLTIFRLFKNHRPLAFFALIAFAIAAMAFGLGLPIVLDFLETGTVARFPTAMIVVGLGICSLISLVCGLMLDSITQQHVEAKRLAYLSFRLR